MGGGREVRTLAHAAPLALARRGLALASCSFPGKPTHGGSGGLCTLYAQYRRIARLRVYLRTDLGLAYPVAFENESSLRSSGHNPAQQCLQAASGRDQCLCAPGRRRTDHGPCAWHRPHSHYPDSSFRLASIRKLCRMWIVVAPPPLGPPG